MRLIESVVKMKLSLIYCLLITLMELPYNLKSTKKIHVPHCPFCTNKDQTFIHLFVSCPFSNASMYAMGNEIWKIKKTALKINRGCSQFLSKNEQNINFFHYFVSLRRRHWWIHTSEGFQSPLSSLSFCNVCNVEEGRPWGSWLQKRSYF